jgi:hypothetical protein
MDDASSPNDLDLQSKDDSGRNIQTIFSLRLHSSILEGDATEILLPEDYLNEAMSASPEALRDDDGHGYGQLRHNHNHDGMDPTTPVTVRTEHVGRTHLYTSDKDINAGGALVYSGATSSQQRLVVKPSKEIKDLGKKAKARLEEEKLKRPEIVMLDSMPLENPEATKRRPKSKSLIPKRRDKPKPTPRQTKKRKLNTFTSLPKQQRAAAGEKTNRSIDDWMPDVSRIPTYAKEIRSTMVQLHGVPLGCTVEQIKRFFKGLEPERVFVLLRNQAHIPMFDATTDYSYSTLERCENDIRVFVKFAASPTAALATERSGEAIVLDHDGSSDLKGATVAVTQVSKHIGSVLLETLVSTSNKQQALGLPSSSVNQSCCSMS